jgi:sterol desaturase/sphingolipid hydroxylase (fatty acid hydroxylase superfamily)
MTIGTTAGIPMNRRDERATIPAIVEQRQALRVLLSAIAESRANYCASYAIDLACPLALGYLGWRHTRGWLIPVASGCAGLASFSLVEYAIHRWLFHRPSSTMGAVHQAHHDAPHGHAALPCITSAVVAVLASWVLSAIVGPAVASFFLCGLMSGYFYYAALHHFEHSIRINALPFRFLQRRWAVHAVHHRLGDANYGVTTSFWDRVFGTGYKSRRKVLP